MATSVTYPGVYIVELPSGVHTITGVATSIGAFVGWAPQGPTTPTLILSWADFARTFGGLDTRSLLGYSVSQFFANGGNQCYIVRLVDTVSGTPAAEATATLNGTGGNLVITASNPGLWGN